MSSPTPEQAPLLQREPALATGLLTSLVAAAISIGTDVGLHLPTAVQAGIFVAAAVLGPLVSALRTRGLVFSPATWTRAQNDLGTLSRALQDAESEINGHGDALSVVEATIVSALNQLLAPAAPPAQSFTPDPTATVQAPAQGSAGTTQGPVASPTMAWSTSHSGPWTNYPPGSVSATGQMTAIQPPA